MKDHSVKVRLTVLTEHIRLTKRSQSKTDVKVFLKSPKFA